jgi:uncharacterized membrane-anchored protein
MVVDRVRLLSTGREIVLPIVPVDPRDLFRGEYVRLGYDVARVPVSLLEGPPPDRNAPFYVTLAMKDGAWQVAKASRFYPAATNPEQVVLTARANQAWPQGTARPNTVQFARYGIESYFVPEGEGLRLEKLATQKKLAARIAVDGRGNAAIKGLIIDGVTQYEEPLF